jgi:hypothetical protein
VLRAALCLGGITLSLLACYWDLRLAFAPGGVAYWKHRAGLPGLDGEGATRALERAAAENPYDSSTWIALGLQAELDRRWNRAEQCYREAAQVSRLFLPRWTLANYFFRRDDPAQFWNWTRQALTMAYGDASPVFRLCWQMSRNPDEILARAIPPRHDIERQYLMFLIAENRRDAAVAVSRKVLAQAGPDDLPDLLACDNSFLDAGMTAPALDIWNALCRRKLVPYPPLDAERGMSLTNGAFATPPLSNGFDWRLPADVGLRHISNPGALRIVFSGRQPESCEALSQWLPLLPQRKYRLRFEYRTADLENPTGLSWQLRDPSGGGLPLDSPLVAGGDWRAQEVSFSTSSTSSTPSAHSTQSTHSTSGETRLARLGLLYRRATGTTRIEGSLWLRNVVLD